MRTLLTNANPTQTNQSRSGRTNFSERKFFGSRQLQLISKDGYVVSKHQALKVRETK